MRVLFDHGMPWPLRTFLSGHAATRAQDMGWDTLSNGALLAAAEAAGFEVLLTTDKNMRYQQNLVGRRIAMLVLSNAQWPILRLHVQPVIDALEAVTPGSYAEVEIPFD